MATSDDFGLVTPRGAALATARETTFRGDSTLIDQSVVGAIVNQVKSNAPSVTVRELLISRNTADVRQV